MLANPYNRPKAKDLIKDPLIKLYRYLLYEKEEDLAEVAEDLKSCLAYISGLTLLDRSKSIICLLGLMNLYKKSPQDVIYHIEITSSYIPMIEILTICLKDKDNTFIGLYENGLQALSRILDKMLNSNIKSKCIVGGLVALLINAIEKRELKYLYFIDFY